MAKTYTFLDGIQDGTTEGEFMMWLLFQANGTPDQNRNFHMFKNEYPDVFIVLNIFAYNRFATYKNGLGIYTDDEFSEELTRYCLMLLFQFGLTDGLIFLDAISEAKTIAIEKGWFVPVTEIPA